MANITHERLREVLDYHPETGEFFWRIDRGPYKAGARAGSNLKKYRRLWIDGEEYAAHRVAFFWMTGRWPNQTVDHANLDGFDNRWDNLREATRSQNSSNRGKLSNNTSGFKGVSFVKNPAKCGSKPWTAVIIQGGRRCFLGMFATAAEAGAAYEKAALRIHGVFARS